MQRVDLQDYNVFLQNSMIIGAIVNEQCQLWTAIVKHDSSLWYVDSCSRPQLLDGDDFIGLLLSHPATFAIVANDFPE